MRLGVFGGTFDPPHLGHQRLARAARGQLALDEVLWVVTADPPHKRGQPISAAADRLALVQAALAGERGQRISRVDIDRPGPHWAVDTLAELGRQFPGAQLVYLMGGDSLRDLPTWGRPREFLAQCTLGVFRRPGARIDLTALEESLPGLSARVQFVDLEPLDIASHVIRQRLRDHQPVNDWLSSAVIRVISERGLYTAA